MAVSLAPSGRDARAGGARGRRCAAAGNLNVSPCPGLVRGRLFFLLPLWEKVAIGGLRPPFLGTPMLCIGYANSATDEGSLSACASASMKRPHAQRHTPHPPRFARDPLPRGERVPSAIAAPSVLHDRHVGHRGGGLVVVAAVSA